MTEKECYEEVEVKVDYCWIDDESANFKCPECGNMYTANIYRDWAEPCKCGKKYVISQKIWCYELVKGESNDRA